MVEPPSDKGQLLTTLVKGAVGAIPYAGSVLVEFGDVYLNPLQRRQKQWQHEISTIVSELQARSGTDLSQLADNDTFCDAVIQATQVAVRSHQSAKISALKNAVIAAAAPDVEADVVAQFIRYIDELSPSHIALLQLVAKFAVWPAKTEPRLDDFFFAVVHDGGLKLERSVFRSFVRDLENRFLVSLGDAKEFVEYDTSEDYLTAQQGDRTFRPVHLTPLGERFLAFVEGNCEP